MKIHRSTCHLVRFVLLALGSLAVARGGFAQAPADPNSPKLSAPFVFTLSPKRDSAVSVTVESIEQHDAILRAKELESAHAPLLTKAFDLLRYIPIRVSSGDADDFFTPNYLRPGYASVPRETQLFDQR